jgi:RNA recognition motif-containing protein
MNIFVGNLGSQVNEEQLQNLFTPFGEVKSVKIITDNYSGHSKGFAFVEMPRKAEAEQAMAKLNNSSYNAQLLVVNEARPKNDRNNFNKRRY